MTTNDERFISFAEFKRGLSEARQPWTAERMAYQRFTMLYLVPTFFLIATVTIVVGGIAKWPVLDSFGKIIAAATLTYLMGIMAFVLARVDRGHGFGVLIGRIIWPLPIFSDVKKKLREQAEFRMNADPRELYDHERARYERFAKKMGARRR
ncbi:hypothetical protein [Neorhizobium sp. NCHU2750]|uniref:hypothetical protein n=1 Tax=Neorhizobium sp. NCHU2750 TaxID=1825976 RepID=UPI000E7692B3|nr:hypothetical protein NCHU2750_59080 [Neorhizobium sp. NCHU2750]